MTALRPALSTAGAIALASFKASRSILAKVQESNVLKGSRGDQQYDLPRGVEPRTVQIRCRVFSALFGSARLQES